jgi:serine/threonine protein kinase
MQRLSSHDPSQVGPYRIKAELGSGAMGRVLLGAGPDGRPVAVKVVHHQLADNPAFRARFREEVRKSRQVSGAYTTPVLDAGPEDPLPWLATEFLRGPTLRAAIEAAGPLPEAAVLRLAAGLASALAAIHQAGVIHRDLKPGNVILTADGPRVVDFGIARAAEPEGSDLTHTGGILGTPEYMSPEQADAAPLTPASDVFSFGSVIVAAARGTGPFAADSARRILNNVVSAEPDLEGLPERIRAIAERCLVREPELRPSPAEVLALIGPVEPTTRPWPDAVAALADRQHRELADVLDRSGEDTTLIDDGWTMVTDPMQPTWNDPTYALPRPPTAPAGSHPRVGYEGRGAAGWKAPVDHARASGLLLLGAFLAAVAVPLFCIGLYRSGAEPGYWYVESWIWLVELVAVVLLFATRRARWGGLLIGATAWNLIWLQFDLQLWLTPYVIVHESFYFYLAGDIAASAGFVCLVVALLVRRPDLRPQDRLPFMLFIAVLALGTTAIAARLLDLFSQPGPTALTVLAIASTLVVLSLAAHATPAAKLGGLGWLLGGAATAGTETANYYYWNDSPIEWVAAFWVALAITAVAVFAVFRSRRVMSSDARASA